MIEAYLFYDEWLDGGSGWNAVVAGHFNGVDQIRKYPYRERWIGRLPFVADAGSITDLMSWKDQARLFRVLYISRENDFISYLNASHEGRSVCVIRHQNGLTFYGNHHSVEYVKKHIDQWRWWPSHTP